MATRAVDTLYGMRAPSQAQARRGLADLEKRLERQVALQASRREAAQRTANGMRERLNLKDPPRGELAAAIKGMRAEQERGSKRSIKPPAVRPGRPRIFTGSVGATVPPPYNWSWTWEASNGGPDINSASADNGAGTWSVSDWTSFNDSSNASARAAVGIFFRPITEVGILDVWSNPGINFDWGDWCVLDGAGSDGWLGLYIGEYDVEGGGFVSAPVDQQINLWSDNSWWSGVGEQEGSNSGYPLFASLEVDNNHFYEIWVWGGTDVYAAGWGGTFGGSGAGGDLSTSVPSITWELF